MRCMLSAVEADRARLADIEAQILDLERRSLSEFPLIPIMLSSFGADRTLIADIESQIRHLERSLSQLRAEKTLVHERIYSYKYPVLTLPNEIVSEIFIHFLPVYPLCPPLTGVDSPIFLTQLCRHWRAIALATPELWRAVRLCGRISFDKQRHMAHSWLMRSRSCPLSIDITDHPDWLQLQVMPLVSHRARWEHLRLDLKRPHLPTFQGPIPLLRHLDLAFKVPAICELTRVPSLRSVVLNHVAAFCVTLPWTQLTSLTLRGVQPSQCVPILRQTSNLVHCELCVHNQTNYSNQRTPDVAFPFLKSLVLKKIKGDCPVTGYLETFVVPALRGLQIPEKFLGSNPIGSLTGFIAKSGCSLQEIHITGKRRLHGDSYFQEFPSIRISFEKGVSDTYCHQPGPRGQ
jgi:hypothetical protein